MKHSNAGKQLILPANIFPLKQVHLSPNQIRIVKLVCKEFTSKEIAEKMGLTFRTVESYRAEIMKKIKVRSTAGIVMYAVRSGIVKV